MEKKKEPKAATHGIGGSHAMAAKRGKKSVDAGIDEGT